MNVLTKVIGKPPSLFPDEIYVRWQNAACQDLEAKDSPYCRTDGVRDGGAVGIYKLTAVKTQKVMVSLE